MFKGDVISMSNNFIIYFVINLVVVIISIVIDISIIISFTIIKRIVIIGVRRCIIFVGVIDLNVII